MVSLCDEVRATCARIAAGARSVTIDHDRLADLARSAGAAPPLDVGLDPERHYLDGSREAVVAYLLTLDTINFGSGWFPTLQKRRGCSGYFTVAWALADRFRSVGPWSPGELRALDRHDVAAVLGQDERHPLMRLYSHALQDLGRFFERRRPLDFVDGAGGSAERLAGELARGMRFFDDRGFYKRAQITASDLALAAVAEFVDLDRLTIFADNLVPHVLRVEGVLRYSDSLAARIDRGELLPVGPEEREIRGCAVHACESIAGEAGIPPRKLDMWLWNRGQAPGYKATPRHRTRTVFY